MKVDYSKWKTRSLSIENLKLDIKNPRFSYQSTKVMNQTEIIKYLVANHAVYELAKDIAINCYLLNEEPIVCKEGETYVVLEGNRRVAACKILLNPYKYLSSQRAKELTKYDKINDKLTCYIAPNRRDSDILIYNKHTGTPLQKWDKVSQDAFLVTLIKTENLTVEGVAYKLNVPPSDIRKALRRYTIHQYCIKLFQYEPYELEQIQEQSFPITTFERFYDSDQGAKFLGISFNSNGEIQQRLPQNEFNKRFRFIVEQILNQDLTSRTFNNDKDKQEYFASINNFNKERFDLDIPISDSPITPIPTNPVSGAESEEKPESNGNEPSENQRRSRKKSGLFEKYQWNKTGVSKLDTLFDSIQLLNFKRHTDMAGIALRCYVDMLVYQFLFKKKRLGELNKDEFANFTAYNEKRYAELKKYIQTTYAIGDDEINDEELKVYTKFNTKENINKPPELGNMIAYILKNPELLNNNTRLLQVLEKFKNSRSTFVDLKSCNMFVHNEYYSANYAILEACANELAPVLDAMYKSIVDEK